MSKKTTPKKRTNPPPPRFETAADVRAFFAACDAEGEEGREPDWKEHLKVIEASRQSGAHTR